MTLSCLHYSRCLKLLQGKCVSGFPMHMLPAVLQELASKLALAELHYKETSRGATKSSRPDALLHATGFNQVKPCMHVTQYRV